MGDKTRGLYEKFTVIRNDGSSEPGGKHHGCEYFVLDLTHDQHAAAALMAYADSCEADYPLLASDLRSKLPPNAGGNATERSEGRVDHNVGRLTPGEEND